jgi:phosphate-selective porin OprO/OprP
MQCINIMVILFYQNIQNRDVKNYLPKNFDGTLTGDEVQVGIGLNLQTGYLLFKTLEISARYTNVSSDKKK